ncbi:MAG: immunoglobulin domain-containing protein, partial [Phycisphaerales bacterium]|nr:immunoglobulin domain-containing protein [Phycisphaerales bacterium]
SAIDTATVVGLTAGTARQYTDNTSDPGIAYRYWVRAVGNTSPSCPSGLSSATGSPVFLRTGPAAPPQSVAVDVGCYTRRFSWPAAAGATGYRVVLDTPGGPILSETQVAGTSANLDGAPGSASRVRVFSLNTCGQSAAAATASFVPPESFAYVENAVATIQQPCRIEITWSRTDGPDYGVKVRRSNLTTGVPIAGTYLLAPGTTSWIDTGAIAGNEYEYEIVPNQPCPALSLGPPLSGPKVRAGLGSILSSAFVPAQRPPIGGTATLSVPTPPGSAAVAFAWWKRNPANTGFTRVADSARVSGASTPTLTIHSVTPDDNGSYTLFADYPCQTTGVNVMLVVNDGCRADFDSSGSRDVSDIFAFLSAWFAGC